MYIPCHILVIYTWIELSEKELVEIVEYDMDEQGK